MYGIEVAWRGDTYIFHIKGHSARVIAQGDSLVLDEGKPVVFDGHKTLCGATLISSVQTTGRD